MFGRRRFGDVIDRQLDLFERENADEIGEAHDRLAAYNAAERDEAEELYDDYADSVDWVKEALEDLRDAYARTLDDDTAERYEAEFNRSVARRLPAFALGH